MRGMSTLARTNGPHRLPRGLSIVELMVGVAVGLFVVAGASFVAVNQLGDNRRMTLETQVQQDLRAAADVVARDLRRSGYWGLSQSGAWYSGGPALAANPYTGTSPDGVEPAVQEVTFAYSRDAGENGILDANEQFGFKLDGDHVIKILVGGAWQSLTDPNVLKVTAFDVTLAMTTVQLSCFKECAGGGTACWPQQDVRRFTVNIAGEAMFDPSVKRSVSNSVRLRNDAVRGACPA
jgi:prepilin peptidase dependent protein B